MRYVIQALDLQEALREILSQIEPLGRVERLPLDALNGRVAAAGIRAPVSLPPFASSAMDGYACRAVDLNDGARLVRIGESMAGHPFAGRIGQGECVRITTGAAVPDTADTVVIQENTTIEGDRVSILETPAPGANIRQIGHDVKAGEVITQRGQRLNPMDVGWVSACGVADAEVFRLPRVAVFSTGDELTVPGQPLSPGRIYDSNRIAVSSLLATLPAAVTDLGILPDDPERIRTALQDASASHDLLLTSGGVSVGDADYLKEVVESLGALTLWRMNLKPGKPLAFGQVAGTPFLGLPGNPVSTIVTFLLVARPVVLRLAGTDADEVFSLEVRLDGQLRHNPGREEFQRGVMQRMNGERRVRVSGDQSSNRLATFSGADCLIRIPKDSGNLEDGEMVEVIPFHGLLG